MKLHYYEDTDSLYIDLSAAVSSDSRKIPDGVVVNCDTLGHVIGVDLQQASRRLDLSTIETSDLPVKTQRIA